MKTDNIKKIRNSCKTINILFSNHSFFSQLYKEVDNDFDKMIIIIGKIINYYIKTSDENINYSIKELIEKVNNYSSTDNNYYIYPTNFFYYNIIRLYGLNNNPFHIKKLHSQLEELEKRISFNPKITNEHEITLYKDISDAITESFSAPEIIFSGIIKQPSTMDISHSLMSEKDYYFSILKERITNVDGMIDKSNAKTAKKAMSLFVGQDSLLVIVPSQSLNGAIDTPHHMLTEQISPTNLSFIRLPSRYKLLKLCAKQQDYQNQFKDPVVFRRSSYPITYECYELLTINDEFEYDNEELSGDPNYDIDLIYGPMDFNNSKSRISNNSHENIVNIKSNSDISVRKFNGKYTIMNGRHRLIYLKQYYRQNYSYYQARNKLQYLDQEVTIPVNIEKVIEDKEFNKCLINILKLYSNSSAYKIDINNDLPEILLIIRNKVYVVRNIIELKELSNYLKSSDYNNKYYICSHNSNSDYDYDEIFKQLLITIKEPFYKMNIYDVISYLYNNSFIVANKHIDINNINYKSFLHSYYVFIHNIQLHRIFNHEIDLIKLYESENEKNKVAKYIDYLLETNSNYASLDIENLYNELIKYDELKDYPFPFIRDCLKKTQYLHLRLQKIYKTSPPQNKKL